MQKCCWYTDFFSRVLYDQQNQGMNHDIFWYYQTVSHLVQHQKSLFPFTEHVSMCEKKKPKPQKHPLQMHSKDKQKLFRLTYYISMINYLLVSYFINKISGRLRKLLKISFLVRKIVYNHTC